MGSVATRVLRFGPGVCRSLQDYKGVERDGAGMEFCRS